MHVTDGIYVYRDGFYMHLPMAYMHICKEMAQCMYIHIEMAQYIWRCLLYRNLWLSILYIQRWLTTCVEMVKHTYMETAGYI